MSSMSGLIREGFFCCMAEEDDKQGSGYRKGEEEENGRNGNEKCHINVEDLPRVVMEEGEFRGQLVKGKREGEGKMEYKDGREFTGEWKDNMREGMGKGKTAAGDV